MRCEHCGDLLLDGHECKAPWEYLTDPLTEPDVVRAHGPEEAAELAAEKSGFTGQALRVWVRPFRGTNWTIVTVERVRQFVAVAKE